MALTKTLATLLERAERKGEAIKRVRYNQIMGNENSGNTDFVNQWQVKMYTSAVDGATIINVLHYDTLIARIENFMPNGYRLVYWYGESNADRDALNGLCYLYGINKRFSYSRKNEEFMEV